MTMEPNAILIRLFGTPSIVIDDKAITTFRSSRILALFALMSSRPGPWSREVVATTLWPDTREEDARHNLRQVLLYVKQMLGDQALVTTRQSIAFGDTVKTDLQSILRIQDSLLSPEESLSAAAEAVSAYQGALLPGFDDEWLEPIRYQCNHAYVEALVRLSDSLVASSPSRALELLEMAIQIEPFLENLRAKKIQILIAMGEQASAHRELASFRKFLDQELGIEPSKMASDALLIDGGLSARSSSELQSIEVEDPISYLLRSSRPARGLQLAIDMVPYWIGKGAIEHGIEILKQAIDISRGYVDKDLEHRAAIELAGLYTRQVRFFEAHQLLGQVLGESKTPQVRLSALLTMLRLHISSFQTNQGCHLLDEMLALAESIGNRDEQMDVSRWASEIEIQLGNLEKAQRHANRCTDLARQAGDWQTYSTGISLLAIALTRSNRLDEANRAVQMGLNELTDKVGLHAAFTRGRFSRILEELGETDVAEQGYRRAIEDARIYGDKMGLAVALTYLGDLLHASHRNEEALACHEEALEIRRDIHEQLGEATSLRGIGRIHLAEGRLAEARQALRESSRLFLICDAEPGHASALLELARVAEKSGERDLAYRIAVRARDLLMGMTAPPRLLIGPSGDRSADDADQLAKRLMC